MTIGGKQGKILSEIMPNPNEQFDYAQRIAAYENATKLLAHRVSEMTVPTGFRPKYNMTDIVFAFRTAFKSPTLRGQLLAPQYERERIANARFGAGFCGVASYTWNHMFRMWDGVEIWRLKQTHNLQSSIGIPNHVWLENIDSGEILDLTFDQFVDKKGAILEFPYEFGEYASANFAFRRGYIFGRHIGVDLEQIAILNVLRAKKEQS